MKVCVYIPSKNLSHNKDTLCVSLDSMASVLDCVLCGEREALEKVWSVISSVLAFCPSVSQNTFLS